MNDLIQRVGFPMFIQLVLESWNEIILLMLTAVMLIGKSKDRQNELINKIKIPLTNELKVIFDVTMVAVSMITCLVVIHSLGSVGIGTVVAAILVGSEVKLLTKFFGGWRNKVLGVNGK